MNGPNGCRGFHASYPGICAQPLTSVVNDQGHHPGAGVRKGSEVGYVGNESGLAAAKNAADLTLTQNQLAP